METTASGGVDRTVLRLSYEGHQPDTEAMRRLYDNPDAIIFKESTQENGGSTPETVKSAPENGGSTPESKGESTIETQSKGESTQETVKSTQEKGGSTPESKGESTMEAQSKGESKGENESLPESKGKSNGERVLSLLKSKGELTLPEVAQILNLSLGGVEKIIRQLKQSGVLIREGSTKAGRWIVKN